MSGFNRTLPKYLALLFALVFCAACVKSPDLNTPREIVYEDDSSSSAFSIAVEYDGSQQDMELIDNLFHCEVREASPTPIVSLRVELQNISPPAGNYINSMYFRTDSLPADGLFHSLSGDPTTADSEAAKIVVSENNRFVSVIPQQKSGAIDNFLVSVRKVEDRRQLRGRFLCTTTLSTSGRVVEFAGDFTINY